MPEYFR